MFGRILHKAKKTFSFFLLAQLSFVQECKFLLAKLYVPIQKTIHKNI